MTHLEQRLLILCKRMFHEYNKQTIEIAEELIAIEKEAQLKDNSNKPVLPNIATTEDWKMKPSPITKVEVPTSGNAIDDLLPF